MDLEGGGFGLSVKIYIAGLFSCWVCLVLLVALPTAWCPLQPHVTKAAEGGAVLPDLTPLLESPNSKHCRKPALSIEMRGSFLCIIFTLLSISTLLRNH